MIMPENFDKKLSKRVIQSVSLMRIITLPFPLAPLLYTLALKTPSPPLPPPPQKKKKKKKIKSDLDSLSKFTY